MIKKYFNIPEFASSISSLSISKQVKNAVQSKFDIFWLKEINTRLPGAVPQLIGLFLFCIEFGWG